MNKILTAIDTSGKKIENFIIWQLLKLYRALGIYYVVVWVRAVKLVLYFRFRYRKQVQTYATRVMIRLNKFKAHQNRVRWRNLIIAQTAALQRVADLTGETIEEVRARYGL